VPRMHPIWRTTITVLGLIALAYSGVAYLQEVTGMKLQIGPAVGIVIGLLIIAGSVAWHIQNSKAQSSATPTLSQVPPPPTAPQAPAPQFSGGGIVVQGAADVRITNNKSHDNSGPNIGVFDSKNVDVQKNETYNTKAK
jgi:hypothetical protein